MVTVDDATYVAMRDNLYKGDAAAASRAKAKIESSYSQEKYDTFLSQLNGLSGSTPKTTTTTTTRATPQDTSRDQGNGNYVYNPNTGYYEKEGTARATQTTPITKQDTGTKQQETAGSTGGEIKQQGAMKPLSQEYYNQTNDVALNQIRDNLNRYKQSNPEYFVDYETFKNNFSYDARNDEQKTLLDDWYKGYQDGLSLASTPTTDLYTQYQNKSISAEQLEQLRISDPAKYSELMNQINKGNIIAAYDDDSGVKGGTSLQDMAYEMLQKTFLQFMSGENSSLASQYFADYKANMDSPEMLELQDKTTELEEQAKNIQDQIYDLQKDVEKEYEGTGASKSKINAIIADRTYELQQQLRTINNEYEKYATQYNNKMAQYQNEFSMQLQEYQINMEARNQQMKELGFAMDMMSFETPQQAQERQWNYWVMQQEYANGNINSKDYSTRHKAALKSVENLLAQFNGIPMERSAEEMADDILKAIDNGSTLGKELSKINQQIQQKPEYRQLYNQTYGTSQGFGKTVNIGGTDYVEYNGKLYTASEFNKQFGGSASYTVVSPDKLAYYSDGKEGTYGSFMSKSKYDDGNYIGQCGKFVNDYLEEIGAGRPFGKETIDVREKWINSTEGKVGTVAVFDYNHYIDGKNYGHVGIVVSAPDKNGDFWVKDANFDSDGVIHTRKVNLKDASFKGFIDPSKDQNGKRTNTGTTATLTSNSNSTIVDGIQRNYDETDIGLYNAWLNNGTSPTDAKLKAMGGGDLSKGLDIFKAQVQDYMNKTGASPLEKQKNDEITKLRAELHKDQAFTDYNQMNAYFNKIKDYSNNETASSATDIALLFNYMKMLDPKSIVRESEFKTAQDMGSLPTKWKARLKDLVNGEKLTDSQRDEIYRASAMAMDAATYQYNNLLDEYAGYINYGGDRNQLGLRGEYYTDDYKNLYGTTTNTPQQKNFYNTYVNTNRIGKRRPFVYTSADTITLSNGQTFER